MGNLVFQATLGGQVNLVGPNTSSTYNINVPAVAGTMVVTGTSPTFTQVTAPTIGAASSASLALQSNGTTNATLDTSGNLGLGVTPSGWLSSFKSLDIGTTASFAYFNSGTYVYNNFYYNSGSNPVYKGNGYAQAYIQNVSGQHAWNIAANNSSGAGASCTFTQAMTLDSSGNLLVGGTTQYGAARLTLTAGGAYLALNSTSAGYSLVRGFDSGTERWAIGQIGFGGADGMAFYTGASDTERARINSSGNFILGGTVVDSGCLQTIIYNGGTGANGIGVNETSGQSGATFAVFTTGVLGSTASNIGTITRVGATSAVIYNTTSDYRLKTVIGPVSGYKERINALEPIEFEWKEDGTRTRGFLAHQFQESYAHSVTGEKDAVDKDGNPVYQAMQAGTSEVIADLVALLKEQQAIIETLTNRITALEAK